jgi:hypothetical protein
MEFDVWTFFENLLIKFKFYWNLTRITGASNENLRSFISQFFLEWEMVQTKAVEKIKTHILYSIIFIVAPCILITLKFLSPTNAPLYYTPKMLKYTVKISHNCFYMFRSIWTIIPVCRAVHGTQYTPQLETLFTNIAGHLTTCFYWVSTQNCNFSKVQHKLPDDGPNGPKHVEAIMRYFNCIF